MSRVLLQSAFVLHSRAYRDTSLIVDIFTENYGRIALVARGARRAKSQWQGLLQPFRQLLISWTSKSDLGTLISAEHDGEIMWLKGPSLISGLYANELIMRLMHRDDAHPQQYVSYQCLLLSMYEISLHETGTRLDVERVLRLFERDVLSEFGYGLVLDHDVRSGQKIKPDSSYYYYPDEGPVCIDTATTPQAAVPIQGKSLISLQQGSLDDETCLREIKRLMRVILNRVLGNKPLNSRELYKIHS